MSKRQTRLSRTQFQDYFLMRAALTAIFLAVIVIGTFFDADAFFALIPLGILGFIFGAHRLAGWIYDRRYRRF